MKICLPVIENTGITSPISQHFGSAPLFLIVETNTQKIQEIKNSNQNHAHGMCQPLSVLSSYEFDAIAVSGIGMGALNKLRAANIKVYKGNCQTVKEALNLLQENKLQEVDNTMTCQDHHCH